MSVFGHAVLSLTPFLLPGRCPVVIPRRPHVVLFAFLAKERYEHPLPADRHFVCGLLLCVGRRGCDIDASGRWAGGAARAVAKTFGSRCPTGPHRRPPARYSDSREPSAP